MDLDKRTKFKDEAVKKINEIMPDIFEIYRHDGDGLREDLDYLLDETMKEYDKLVREREGGISER